MDLLSSIESRIEKVMSRLFSGRKGEEQVQPVMIAQELVKAMESARHVSVEAIYVPNHFQVRLHPLDHQAIQPVQYTVTGTASPTSPKWRSGGGSPLPGPSPWR